MVLVLVSVLGSHVLSNVVGQLVADVERALFTWVTV